MTGLEDEYIHIVHPILDYLQRQQSAMGEQDLEAMFLPHSPDK